MKSIETLKAQMQGLLDQATDKSMIEALTKVGEAINQVEADTTALETDNRSLLNDYKEMVKHTSFRLDKAPEHGAQEPLTFENFFKEEAAKLSK